MNLLRRTMLLAGAALAAGAARAAEPTAAQVVEKNVAARGGLAAWRAVTGMTLAGEMDAGGKQPMRLPYVMHLKRPHKSHLEIAFVNQTAIQTFDGQQGWKFRPYLNRSDLEPLSVAELRAEKATDELDGPLIDHARKGVKVVLVGTEQIEGRNTYRLKLTRSDGSARQLWVDAQTFLEARIEGEPRRMDSRMRRVFVYYRDFKKTGNVMVPHTLETVVEGVRQASTLIIDKVEINPKLDDALFGKPQVSRAAAG